MHSAWPSDLTPRLIARYASPAEAASTREASTPYKVFNNPIRSGPTAGKVIDRRQFERLLDL